MSSFINSISNIGAHLEVGKLARFIPEPKSKSGLSFGGVLDVASSLTGSFLSKAAGNATGFGDLNPEYVALIQQQIEVQKQMQLMTFVSNIEKSKHETKMAAVRNIRVG